MIALASLRPRTIHRYILREATLHFSIALFAFTGILLTVRMLKLASLVINKGVPVTQIAQVFLFVIPTFLEVALPLAALLGIMLAIARLSGDSEVVVMRASGISIYQLIPPIFFFGAVVAAANLYISLQLRPWAFRNLEHLLFEIASTRSTSGLDAGIFNKLGNLTLYADEIDQQTGELRRVLIDDRRDSKNRKIVVARRGRITSDEESRAINFALREGEIHEEVEGKYALTHFDQNGLRLDANELYDEESLQKTRSTRALFLPELTDRIHAFREHIGVMKEEPAGPSREERVVAGLKRGIGAPSEEREPKENPLFKGLSKAEAIRKYNRLRIEKGLRFAMPMASFVLALFALPLGIQPPRAQRTWGATLSAILGLLVFVCYYGVLSIGAALAESGRINAYVSLWTPNLLAAVVAVIALHKTGSEQWQSIAQGFEGAARTIGGWMRSRRGA